MANALSFVGSGSASVPNYVWRLGGNSIKGQGPAGAVEFYVQTTSTHQALFSASTTFEYGGQVTGRTGFVLALDEKGCVTIQGTGLSWGKPKTVVYTTATAVNDGKWHQISAYSPGGSWNLYVDGVAVKFEPSGMEAVEQDGPQNSDLGDGDGFTGSIYFGEDKFNATPWAPPYNGLMSEIRVWNGGNPSFILKPAFSLNVGVPVASNTPNLGLYWPFWTNQETPLIDKVAKTPLVLGGQSIQTNVGQFYNDLSEVLCNGTMADFDPFTEGTTGAAFTWLLKQANLAGYTPASFRAIYAQQSYSLTFSGWQGDIRNAKYPGTNGGTKDFTQADFTHVQDQLVNELEGVVLVWGFYQAAYDNLGFIAAQYNNAAATVYSTLIATSIQLNNPVPVDLQGIFNAAASVASAVPDYGAIVAAAIKVAGTAISYAQAAQSPYIDFSTTLKIEAQASNLESAVNTVIQDMYGAILTSLAIILRNSGLLNLVAQRVDQGETFEFGPDLNPKTNPDLRGLLSVYNAAILLFAQTVLCNSFPVYLFESDYPAYDKAYTFHIQDGLFNWSYGDGEGISPFTGQIVYMGQALIGTCVEDGYHGFPEFTTLSVGAGDLLRNAASALNGQSFQQSELYKWPFKFVTRCSPW
jgi:Concanavalin A-like lectin/glucanases superfamily